MVLTHLIYTRHICLYKLSVGAFIIGHVEKSNLIILIIYKHNCFPFIFKYIIKMFQYTNTNAEYICVNPRSIDVMFFAYLMMESIAGLSF